LARDREQFERWLTEWKDHTWSHSGPGGWSRLQVADSDVHERTRRILASPAHDDLDRLAHVAEAVRAQRDMQNRCRARIGEEARALREAGGGWLEIADWTTIDEKTVRALARAGSPKPDAWLDRRLADLLAGVPNNPFVRICDLLAAARLYEAVANELDDVTDWLCFELSDAGVGRTQIARQAHLSQLTVVRRISRARRNALQRGTG
jgi:hypothetical protein